MKFMLSPETDPWKSLLERLTAIAFGWFKDRGCSNYESVLPGTGMSAIDLAFNARLELIKNESNYHLTSDKDRFRLLVIIMRNDFCDLVKRLETKRTVFLSATSDGDGRSELENLPDPNSGFASAEAALAARSLYPLAEGEQELIDLIDAVAIFGRRKREDIADLGEVSPVEVTKRQKKLKYRRARQQRPVQAKLGS